MHCTNILIKVIFPQNGRLQVNVIRAKIDMEVFGSLKREDIIRLQFCT